MEFYAWVVALAFRYAFMTLEFLVLAILGVFLALMCVKIWKEL